MAKEMMIMFVYDTQFAKPTDDDPASAILYFHPNWVSDQQRTSLCGQIIGTAYCLKTVFNCPRILALQSGKFCICDYGRYIMVVGTDRNVADWVLEYRTHILSSFITFFHQDLKTVSQLYENSENFSIKLYYMFDTYLKVLMYGGNMFSNIPSIQLPKSASNVFLEAIQVLRYCQKVDYVLGGTILYHNKVVATQFGSNITKRLVLTDPYRIKSPAETVKYNFKLPIGVQLLRVYIEVEDYEDLLEDSTKLRTAHQYLNKNNVKTSQPKTNSTMEPILLTMKRDQSLIFTTVPEEDVDNCTLIKNISNNTKSQNRPKYLNLMCKTTDNKSKVKNESRPVPSTPFFGNTSICSTPMTDLNKVLHQNVMSICLNLQDNNQSDLSFNKVSYETDVNGSQGTDSVNSLLSAVSEISDNSGQFKHNRSNTLSSVVPHVYGNFREYNRSFSSSDVRTSALKFGMDSELVVCDFNNSALIKPSFKTITDPTFPVFRSDGMPVSESLHHYYICNGDLFNMKLQVEQKQLKQEYKEVWLSIKDFDVEMDSVIENKSAGTNNKHGNSEVSFISKISDENKKRKHSKDFRKSLSLPLKSLTSESNGIQSFSGINKHSGIQLTPLLSKLSALAMDEKSSGFCSHDATPNEYKDTRFSGKPIYSFLNTDNKSSKSANKFKLENNVQLKAVVLFICGQQDMVINLLLEEEACETNDIINNVWHTCVDYLGRLEKQIHHCLEMYPGANCQNENSEPYSYLCMNPHWDTIQKGGPWSGIELGALTHLHRDFINENNLTEILLRVTAKTRNIFKGVFYFVFNNQTFKHKTKQITVERKSIKNIGFVLTKYDERDDDCVMYGHNCGKTEVFYQQSTTSNAGLPTPADPMGIIPLKAKRRLERDHGIILN